MGCDIHMVLERKWNDKWVGVRDINGDARERNYDLFAKLAGVRGGHEDDDGEPRGVPEDASELTKMHVEGWDG